MSLARLTSVFLAFVIGIISGCSHEQPLPGQAVSGEVLVEGEPLDDGQILFKPMGETQGPKISARIKGGKFHIPKEQGPWVGEFQVSISTISADLVAFQAGASHEEVAAAARLPQRKIAKEFDQKSKLTFVVQKGDENRCRF